MLTRRPRGTLEARKRPSPLTRYALPPRLPELIRPLDTASRFPYTPPFLISLARFPMEARALALFA